MAEIATDRGHGRDAGAPGHAADPVSSEVIRRLVDAPDILVGAGNAPPWPSVWNEGRCRSWCSPLAIDLGGSSP